MQDVREPKSLVINWPMACLLMFTAGCMTLLALAGFLTRDLVLLLAGMICGVAVPTQPLATRFRTVYSQHPPPLAVTSDRPEPMVKP